MTKYMLIIQMEVTNKTLLKLYFDTEEEVKIKANNYYSIYKLYNMNEAKKALKDGCYKPMFIKVGYEKIKVA